VFFCIPNLSAEGGGAKRIVAETAGLDQCRLDTTLLVHEKIGKYVGRFEDKVRVVYLSDKTYTRWRLPSLLINAIQLVRKTDIIVGANEGRATAVSLLLALLFKKRFVSWIHADWSEFRACTHKSRLVTTIWIINVRFGPQEQTSSMRSDTSDLCQNRP
jgi:hypothetical protein